MGAIVKKRRSSTTKKAPLDSEQGFLFESSLILDHATVRVVWIHVAGLVKQPETMPLFAKLSEVFGSINQLTSANCWIGVVDWKKATNATKK